MCAPGRRPPRLQRAYPGDAQRSRSRSPTTSRYARARRSPTGRPATTLTTPATRRCCRCTRCSARPASRRTRSTSSPRTRSSDGIDELGVLLYGHAKNAYWYGSQLSIEETRQLAPYQNATGLQVTSAVLAGMVWALENPQAGIVEADDIDFRRCLEVQMPYLGPVVGVYTDWTPLEGRPGFFPMKTSTPPIRGSSGTCWCGKICFCGQASPPATITRGSTCRTSKISMRTSFAAHWASPMPTRCWICATPRGKRLRWRSRICWNAAGFGGAKTVAIRLSPPPEGGGETLFQPDWQGASRGQETGLDRPAPHIAGS